MVIDHWAAAPTLHGQRVLLRPTAFADAGPPPLRQIVVNADQRPV